MSALTKLEFHQVSRTMRLIAVAFFVMFAGSSLQAAPDPAAALISAEEGYTRAVIGKDLAALDKTLADDLIYVHASGAVQDKQHYLKGTVDAGWRVIGARISDRRANVYGDIGVTLGYIAYDVGAGERQARYMAVYRKVRDKWLLLRWQNAKPSGQEGAR